MSLKYLRANIEEEKQLVWELKGLISMYYETFNENEKKHFEDAIRAKISQIKILNNSIPELVKNISFARELPKEPYKYYEKNNEQTYGKKQIISVRHTDGSTERKIAIKKSEKEDYIKSLQISSDSLKNLKKKKKETKEFVNEYKKPNTYIKMSNKIFSNISNKLIVGGYFNGVKISLIQGDFTILLKSYVSMMLMTTLISFFIGIAIMVFFLFLNITAEFPFIQLIDFSSSNFLMRLLSVIIIIPLTPIIVFTSMYFYPSLERASIEKKIDYEMPFATIQMAAIAGADIEPSNIFRIVALSKEYPSISKEAKKLMNQINLYGYDLINALTNVAQASPSKEWAELLNGISTTIKSGGDLSKFFTKRAETLLFEYRLKKEKATKSAETFMDIYISVVVAAPMLMMLLLVLMSMSGMGMNIPIPVLTVLIVAGVSLINIIFLVSLHMNRSRL
ncbi:MAG: type II secretion system F family protein [Candidatus Pacearchaeota archaeon]